MAVAAAKLAALHGLPSASWMCTDAMTPDAQAAAETMMAALAHSAGGVGLIWGVGQIESQKTLSPVKAVIDDEIVGMARRFARGSEHTMNHFQGEFYEPKLLCRVSREQWDAAGRRDLADRARERAVSILAADRPPLLDEAATGELRRIEQAYLSQLD